MAKPSIAHPWVQDAVQIIELLPSPTQEAITVFRRSLETAIKGIHVEILEDEGQREWIFEECDDGTARICLSTNYRIHKAFKQAVLQLDAGFVEDFGRHDEVDAQWDAQEESLLSWVRLIKLLHRHIGDDAMDVNTALAIRIVAEGGGWETEDEIAKIADLGEEQKKNGIQSLLAVTVDLVEWGDDDFLQSVLGERYFKRLSSRYEGDIGAIVRRLWAICGRSERVRNSLLRLLEDTLRSSEKLLIGASVRQGWRHLLEAREVVGLPPGKKTQIVMDDIQKKILAERVAIGVVANMTEDLKVHALAKEGSDICTSTESPDESSSFGQEKIRELESQLRRVNRVFCNHFMDDIDPVAVRSLAEVVCWREWQEQLEQAACEGDEFKISIIYKQIAHAVFRAVSDYQHCRTIEDDERVPAYRRGYPINVVGQQHTSCFSGAWLMAALLAKCGIPLKDMRFSLVHQDSDGQIAAHGQVLLLTPWKEVLMLDYGHGACGREFKLRLCRTDQMEKNLEALISGKSTESAVVQVESVHAAILGYPCAMVVMPILDGIASRHLLHVGIEFLEQGQLRESHKAMQLSLDFAHRKNPDALFYIGIIHARNGNTAYAKICFTQALKIFSLHIRSHHALGKVALMEGDHEEAYARFIRVLKIAGDYPIWGDNDFIKEAREYVLQHPKPILTYQI